MFTVVGLGRAESIPEGLPLPPDLAGALGRNAERTPLADGGRMGLIGGPESGDPHLAAIERWGRESGVDVEILWAEPLGHLPGAEGARVIFEGPLLPGCLLVPGEGTFKPHERGLYDPWEKVLFFPDLRKGGTSTAVGELEGREMGSLSAVSRREAPYSSAVAEARTVMAALLGEGGCPWDREQDHLTLRRYLLEEAAEAVDALTLGDMNKSKEELGDLLLQILFHSLLFEREGRFDLSDVARALSLKLVRRHPHVFGREDAVDANWVRGRWAEIKRGEMAGERSLLDEIPKGLGALEALSKVFTLLRRLGLETPEMSGEEGEIIALARRLEERGRDPALALREGVLALTAGLREVEEEARRGGKELSQMEAQFREEAFMRGFETFLNREKED